jgi:hypothetical protein
MFDYSRTPMEPPAFRKTKECPFEVPLLAYLIERLQAQPKGERSLKNILRELVVAGWIERDPDAKPIFSDEEKGL